VGKTARNSQFKQGRRVEKLFKNVFSNRICIDGKWLPLSRKAVNCAANSCVPSVNYTLKAPTSPKVAQPYAAQLTWIKWRKVLLTTHEPSDLCKIMWLVPVSYFKEEKKLKNGHIRSTTAFWSNATVVGRDALQTPLSLLAVLYLICAKNKKISILQAAYQCFTPFSAI